MSPVTAFRTRSLASLAFANQRLPDNGAIRQQIGLRRNPEKNGSRWRKDQSGWKRRRMNAPKRSPCCANMHGYRERKNVVYGKRVPGSVDLGGSGIIKTKRK